MLCAFTNCISIAFSPRDLFDEPKIKIPPVCVGYVLDIMDFLFDEPSSIRSIKDETVKMIASVCEAIVVQDVNFEQDGCSETKSESQKYVDAHSEKTFSEIELQAELNVEQLQRYRECFLSLSLSLIVSKNVVANI